MVGVDAVFHRRAEVGPTYPQGPALKEVGKEKGNCPNEDDGDHSPNGWLDEGSFEYSDRN